MAAGLLASTMAREAMRALVCAATLGALFFFGFVVEVGFWVSGGGATPPFATMTPNEGGLWDLFGNGLQLALDGGACWQELLGTVIRPWLGAPGFPGPSRGLGANHPLLIDIGAASITGPLALVFLIRLASWHLNRAWREEPPPVEVVRIQQALCSPVYFKSAFQRWMRWELNHNPIGWLEQRTWSARLVTWSWFAVFICIYSSLLSNLSLYQRAFHGIQTILAWLLATSVAVSSARSFHRERESGLLELLLVSPLDERQIIFGRIRGLWTQFTPAIVLLLGLWIFLATIIASGEHELGSILFCGSTLLTLPIIGLYESLARKHFVSALLSTLLLGVALPTVLAQLGRFLDFLLWMTGHPHALSQTESDGFLVAILLQCGVAVACVWKLHRNLRARRFALQPM
jgi:ABC-type transport system involved in cytochrome c biogenesis permease component